MESVTQLGPFGDFLYLSFLPFLYVRLNSKLAKLCPDSHQHLQCENHHKNNPSKHFYTWHSLVCFGSCAQYCYKGRSDNVS